MADEPTTLAPLTRQDWAGRYYEQLSKKVAAKEGHTIPVVFVGDSITHAWAWKSDVKYPGGREVWDRELQEFQPLNLGVSGDTVPNVLWRVTEGKQLEGYEAKVIVLMIGVNDLLRCSCQLEEARKIADTLQLLLTTMRQKQPNAKILLLSILPFTAEKNQARQYINDRAKNEFSDGENTIYFDMTADFLDTNGKIINMRDGLHPSPPAYELMAARLIPKLRQLLQTEEMP